MNVTTPSDDQVIAAVREIREELPDIGRAKMVAMLNRQQNWQLSKARLKKLVPTVNQLRLRGDDHTPSASE